MSVIPCWSDHAREFPFQRAQFHQGLTYQAVFLAIPHACNEIDLLFGRFQPADGLAGCLCAAEEGFVDSGRIDAQTLQLHHRQADRQHCRTITFKALQALPELCQFGLQQTPRFR